MAIKPIIPRIDLMGEVAEVEEVVIIRTIMMVMAIVTMIINMKKVEATEAITVAAEAVVDEGAEIRKMAEVRNTTIIKSMMNKQMKVKIKNHNQ